MTSLVARPSTVLRHRLGTALRSRVAGPDAEAAHERIWNTPGPRWFTPDDPIWRIHADASMFPGGIAALLLQSLHPSAMAAVAEHSGYRGDPWGRLQRTSHYLATTTYGTIDHAEQAIAVVRAVHRRVVGTTATGQPYAAGDPHLLTWVHVAEIRSFLESYRAFGSHPISPADADRYVAQSAGAARLLGARDVPTTVAELDDCIASYRPELEVTPQARDACTFLLSDPPLPRPARPGYRLLAHGALHVMPDWGLEMLERPEPAHARAAGRLGTKLVRWGMRAV